MNKNPFLPQPSYTPPQPPLPPGPPPPQPAVPEYPHWPGYPPPNPNQYTPQWTPPTTRPPEQNHNAALFANYGYGPQNQWQRQQQQQYVPPVAQPAMPPAGTAAAYNPYQPAVTYPPQTFAPQAAVGQYAQPPPPMFAPHIPPQTMPMQQQQRPPQQQHQHHQQQPPAKRPRYDGPNTNNHNNSMPNQNQSQNQNQQHRQPFQAGGRGGGPGSNQIPLGSGNRSGRGGGNFGGSNRGGRGGGGMNTGRGGGMSGRPGRGGSTYNVGGGGGGNNPGRGGGGGGGGSMRSHGSRNQLGGSGKDFHNRRGPGGPFNAGGGSYNNQGGGGGGGSFRGRNQGGQNRNQRYDGNASSSLGLRDSTNTKREERRRTLTDFKIVGLEISELSWTWGTLPRSAASATAGTTIKLEDGTESSQAQAAEPSIGSSSSAVIKTEDDPDSHMAVKKEVDDESSLGLSIPIPVPHIEVDGPDDDDTATEVAVPLTDRGDASNESVGLASASGSKDSLGGFVPHSRIRIYFHTPVSADDSQPMSSYSSLGSIPSPSRKGKRKKLDDDDGDLEEGRGAPPPAPQMGMSDDRSSMAPSVAPSVAETASEGDWLMAAIVEGDETQRTVAEDDENDDGDRQRVSEIVGIHENDAGFDVDSSEQHASQGRHDTDHVMQNESAGTEKDQAATGSENDSADGNEVCMDASTSEAQTAPAPANEPPSNVESTPAQQAPSGLDSIASVPDATSSVPAVPHFTFSFHSDLTSTADPSKDTDNTHNAQVTVTQTESQSQATAPPETQAQTQTDSQMPEMTQTQDEHLPEPPISPVSNTLLSTSSSSTVGEASQQSESSDKKQMNTRTPSANRLSISYAGGDRRLIINAEVVESFKVFRAEGRIEIQIRINTDSEGGVEGILMETLSNVTKSYLPIEGVSSDPILPPFTLGTPSSILTLVAYLDKQRPLSEPRWAKSGDIQEWLRTEFGNSVTHGWEKKIIVADPDPPPTIWTVLESWSANSVVGNGPTERQRFIKTHLSETENLLEILLRLVRGERATAFQSNTNISAATLSGPLLAAWEQGTAHGAQQTHVSLAVLAIFQMTLEYACKVVGSGPDAKKEVEGRVGEIIRCLPSHLIYKSMDGMFKEWKAEKKGQGR
uniref:Proteasome subunit alpha type 1 n=1 Tax=Moniliophthora roreri TaxID=221103 RepID=A0A0W0FL96_MONRR